MKVMVIAVFILSQHLVQPSVSKLQSEVQQAFSRSCNLKVALALDPAPPEEGQKAEKITLNLAIFFFLFNIWKVEQNYQYLFWENKF